MNGGNFGKVNGNLIARMLPKEKLKSDIIFILLFSSYIIVNTVNIILFRNDIYDVEINADIGMLRFAGMLAAVFFVLFTVNLLLRKIKNIHRYILFFSSVVYAVGLVAHKNLNMAYNVTVLVVLFYIIHYCFNRKDEDGGNIITADDKNNKPGGIINFRTLMILVSILVLVHIAVMSQATLVRYRAFYASTFDFGIFAQMFENMAKTGLQTTSVERNMPLSHFAVHFSPFYYFLLPFYMPFRSPESLLQLASV